VKKLGSKSMHTDQTLSHFKYDICINASNV